MRNAGLGQLPCGQPGSLQQRSWSRRPVPRRPCRGQCNTRSAPIAVPNAVVASRPVLQCVRTRSGRSGHNRSIRSAACVAQSRLTSASSASICRASASTASGPSGNLASARCTPQARLTAVGRADAIRARLQRDVFVVTDVLECCQRHAESAGHAERGCAPDGQGLDRVDELVDRRDPQSAQLVWQCSLVDGEQRAIGPGD